MLRKLRHILGEGIRFLFYTKYRMMGITIGENTFISMGAWLDERRGKIIIGANCEITSGSKILSHDATMKRLNPQKKEEFVTKIGNSVFIGMNSVVLPGIKIGDNCIVGAGAVVTKNIPPDTVVVGNPAVAIKKYDRKNKNWIKTD